MAYWECNSGVVVSASGFTKAAKDLASKAHTVILWDKPVLEVLIDRYMSQVVVFVAEKQPALGVLGA
jgi:restriction endonuclease Mrr